MQPHGLISIEVSACVCHLTTRGQKLDTFSGSSHLAWYALPSSLYISPTTPHLLHLQVTLMLYKIVNAKFNDKVLALSRHDNETGARIPFPYPIVYVVKPFLSPWI